ncbi:MAG: bifunctional UDP-N-acetylglucosamine diphosphorylase/glucosamine-1-phosphate N-acetyltransferase GlmU [Actinobacteria bacterium]|nr:bifunctional UDP-N-acetylglucosamine diphosphorylase/glucosamine-1-phosphate N-acetyltransferase GlmU [Actinomycetota bacterium]
MPEVTASALILAAGEGTRMKSATPKVLHSILGKSMMERVLNALPDTHTTVVVVGAGRAAVENELARIAPSVSTFFQEERGGTGHATRLAMSAFAELADEDVILVLGSDTPLLRRESIAAFIEQSTGFAAAVMTAHVPQPFGYGRIIRDAENAFTAIIEEKDASEAERTISEINSGIYLFQKGALSSALAQLSRNNAQGEEYLTDVLSILRGEGKSVAAFSIADFREILGVNDRGQLSECGDILRNRINDELMKAGVTIVDPASTWVEEGVEIAADVTLLPGTWLTGSTKIFSGAVIGPRTSLNSCTVESGAKVSESTCDQAYIGEGASVGPYTYLRPGTVLGPRARAGAFVEIKNSTIGPESKVPHLSYVGDAHIGEGSNIGAATVFVNYDGVEKHRTQIGDHVRIGSDTMLVAPVTIGDGAYTAAGSVITEDVPAGAMGVGRAKQRNVLEWVLRKRPGSKSADAASRARDAQ